MPVLVDNPVVFGTFANPRAAASPTRGALRLIVAASEVVESGQEDFNGIEVEDEEDEIDAVVAIASGALLL